MAGRQNAAEAQSTANIQHRMEIQNATEMQHTANTQDKTDTRTDRRVRRTKALLLQSLMQLMETKDIKDISVKELSNLADINRGTFYLHYSDVYDMLSQIEDELFTEFYQIIDRTLTPESAIRAPRTVLFEIFSFLDRHRDMVQVMAGSHGDPAFVNRLKNLVKKRLENILLSLGTTQEGYYTEAFVVSGCTGVMETWLNQAKPASPDTMADICGGILERSFAPDAF